MSYAKICSTIIVICWITPSVALAQSEMDIAIKAGPNAATQDANLRANRYGVSSGISSALRWPFSERFSLASQLELLYTPRGADVVFQGETVGKQREHYLDFTLAAKPEIRMSWASVYFLLGGGLNFLVSASKDDDAGMGQDFTGDLHRVDLALLGGVGIGIDLPRQQLGPFWLGTVFVEARHDVGLLDVDAISGGLKNRTTSVMLGLSIIVRESPSSSVAPRLVMK